MKPGQKQAALTRWMRPVHVYCSLFMLLVALFFAVTGMTLNHREWLPHAPAPQRWEIALPAELMVRERWVQHPDRLGRQAWQWLADTQSLSGVELRYDWDGEGVMLIDAKRPGAYVVAEIDVMQGRVLIEHHRKGFWAVLNDLHMGRYSPKAWRWFIDFSGVAMLVFTLSGLVLVLPQRKRRARLFGLAAAGGLLMLGLHWLAV